MKWKNDKYKKARAGKSRLLNISCAKCNSFLLSYQKDGVGHLKRLYLDRIQKFEKEKAAKLLVCKSCKNILGTYFLYEKENRPAYRLNLGAVKKEIEK
ncbi:MAG: hypothetical protein A3H06_02345 [Candidatus Colwellbacteria bacterium RIFCSPLOWO2_12_FULL_44_13]|uniref:Uncharacterized protein n=3 Tax=Candidatus Colwelliibacteriota TaxID=1817904 RepID=A0A1G1Z5U9_9BACT|nr:MAG: hypothetical protein A3F24_01420 [Candidatus Colwellbacteria bacterium RIFCSPHIGHO2_12_FULL_44_17]OGY59904.1 MAG: hypothetical protein A3I31_01965 [Candidatus Colwellbacteria bacterium RIFCSPLOWO2_02_FULL_44_20b]OGY61782.1 MAG: hypothetical protein A3H06_02345 [Candidatus Colwellbacteria bacterium RIFCSPLOWO2_12_FULL_44_13]